MPLLESCRPEDGVIHLSRNRVETQPEVPAVKGPERMVQEVVAIHAELQLLRFCDAEILEQSQVHVENPRPVNGREDRRTVLADLRGHSEATCVDVLVRSKVGPRVAREDGIKLDIGRAKE